MARTEPAACIAESWSLNRRAAQEDMEERGMFLSGFWSRRLLLAACGEAAARLLSRLLGELITACRVLGTGQGDGGAFAPKCRRVGGHVHRENGPWTMENGNGFGGQRSALGSSCKALGGYVTAGRGGAHGELGNRVKTTLA